MSEVAIILAKLSSMFQKKPFTKQFHLDIHLEVVIYLSRWHAHVGAKERTSFGSVLQYVRNWLRHLTDGQCTELDEWKGSDCHFRDKNGLEWLDGQG